MNILISSVGRRVQLISCFKKEINKVGGSIVALDCDQTAPALYHADAYEVIPRIDDPAYFSVMVEICRRYDISAILTLIDPELSILAGLKPEFEKAGVTVITCDKEAVEICFDKMKTFQFLRENRMNGIPTYGDIGKVRMEIAAEKLHFPLIVKPRKGSGSNGVNKVENMEELFKVWNETNDPIIQPFMSGKEYCVECYVDLLTNETVNFFSKRKINMRAGETDKSVVVRDPELQDISEKLVSVLKAAGPIDIDFFKTENGYAISEINPRFGGGYPYAYEMGVNFIQNIIHNLQGKSNKPYVKYTGGYMEKETLVRYDHFVVL